MIRPEAFDVRLISTRQLAPLVRELVFERVDGRPMQFAPGQWVNLVLPLDLPAADCRRAYSIASAPDGSPRFELAVTRVEGGPGSEHLHAMQAGDVLAAIGPHGLFLRPEGEPPSIFVATGTGVTPLRSMMAAAISARSKAPLWLIFGVRVEADILYRAQLEAWQAEHPNVRVEFVLSRGDETWQGRRGYVQDHLPELYGQMRELSLTGDPQVLICGLDRMVRSVKELARGPLGMNRKHVHVERYD